MSHYHDAAGARGSTALMGAVDTAFSVTKDDFSLIATVSAAKQKDDEPGPDVSLKLEQRTLLIDDEEHTSCVLIETGTPPTSGRERKLSPNQATALQILKETGNAGLSTAAWLEECKAVGIATTWKASFYDLRRALEGLKKVEWIHDAWVAR